MTGYNDLWNVFDETRSQRAFQAIFDAFWERLLRVSVNILKDTTEAEDVVQEVFISLWNRKNQTKIEEIEAYLYNAVKYKVFQRLRNKRADPEQLEKFESIQFANNIEEKFDYESAKLILDQCISSLPDRPKEVFMLSRFENLSNDEIACRLQVSQKTVEAHITKALKTLRKCHSEG